MNFNNCYMKIEEDCLEKLEQLGYKVDINRLKNSSIKYIIIRNNEVFGIDGKIYPNYKTDRQISISDFKDYVFNINDYWYDDIDYVEHFLDELEYSPNDTIEIGEKVPVLHRDIFDLRDTVERMQDQAYELTDEYSEDYLKDLTTEKAEELHTLILEWLDKNINQPKFFNVIGEKEITVQEFRERFL